MKFNEEDIERMLEWMNYCRELMGLTPDIEKSFLLEHTSHDGCSCGGFTFIKTKRGFHIKPELGKILTSDEWKKQHPSKKRKTNEIQENWSNRYKCTKCEIEGRNKGGYFNSPNFVSNGDVCKVCGYKRPTDKEIIELWNKRIELKEMCRLLDEPTANYIKTRLRKYNLYEQIGCLNPYVFDNNLEYSAIVWERVNKDKFPIKPYINQEVEL